MISLRRDIMERATRVTVFEAINRARKEIYIGATSQQMHVTIAAFRASPPPGAAEWLPDEVEFRSLAFELTVPEAAEAVRRYASAHAGWTVLTDPALIGP